MKQPFVIATAAVVGLVAGALSPIVFVASLVLFFNADWPPLSSMAPILAMMSGLGLLSGGIGGWDGWRSGRCRVWPLACAAVFLLLILAISLAQFPPGSIPWSPYLVRTFCLWAPAVWLACWAGQCVGVRGRTKYAEPCAGSDGGLRPAV